MFDEIQPDAGEHWSIPCHRLLPGTWVVPPRSPDTTQEPAHRPAIHPPSCPQDHPCLAEAIDWPSIDPPAHLPRPLAPPTGSRDPRDRTGVQCAGHHVCPPPLGGTIACRVSSLLGFEPVTHWHHAAAASRADMDEARTMLQSSIQAPRFFLPHLPMPFHSTPPRHSMGEWISPGCQGRKGKEGRGEELHDWEQVSLQPCASPVCRRCIVSGSLAVLCWSGAVRAIAEPYRHVPSRYCIVSAHRSQDD